MRRTRRPLIIASRSSPLARSQAEQIARAINQMDARQEADFLWWSGQTKPPATQTSNGEFNKGRFTRGIEELVLAGDADLAVHSLKDLPVEDTPGLRIAAVPAREDVRDVLITPGALTLEQLPENAVLGTSSPRRAMQVAKLRPDLQIKPIEGNIESRIAAVIEHGRFDATILALAGLKRTGLVDTVPMTVFTIDEILPAAGQAALAVQCRTTDHHAMINVLRLNDPFAAQAVHAERSLLLALGCDCDSPVAAYCRPQEDEPGIMDLTLRYAAHRDATHFRELTGSAPLKKLSRLVAEMAGEITQPGRKSYTFLRGIREVTV